MERVQRLRAWVAEQRRLRRAGADGDGSESWVMTCPCGTDVSVWDLGGRRYRLTSKGLTRSAVCPSCRKRFVGRVRRVPV